MILWWLARFIRHTANKSAIRPFVPGEAALVENLVNRGTLEQWIDVWEKISSFLARAEISNLDKKQVILVVFSALSEVARGRPVSIPR